MRTHHCVQRALSLFRRVVPGDDRRGVPEVDESAHATAAAADARDAARAAGELEAQLSSERRDSAQEMRLVRSQSSLRRAVCIASEVRQKALAAAFRRLSLVAVAAAAAVKERAAEDAAAELSDRVARARLDAFLEAYPLRTKHVLRHALGLLLGSRRIVLGGVWRAWTAMTLDSRAAVATEVTAARHGALKAKAAARRLELFARGRKLAMLSEGVMRWRIECAFLDATVARTASAHAVASARASLANASVEASDELHRARVRATLELEDVKAEAAAALERAQLEAAVGLERARADAASRVESTRRDSLKAIDEARKEHALRRLLAIWRELPARALNAAFRTWLMPTMRRRERKLVTSTALSRAMRRRRARPSRRARAWRRWTGAVASAAFRAAALAARRVGWAADDRREDALRRQRLVALARRDVGDRRGASRQRQLLASVLHVSIVLL